MFSGPRPCPKESKMRGSFPILGNSERVLALSQGAHCWGSLVLTGELQDGGRVMTLPSRMGVCGVQSLPGVKQAWMASVLKS